MRTHHRRGLLLLGFLALTGCGDTADTLLRTATNLKCELTDRLMKVTDEQSAEKFMNVYLKNYTDKIKTVDDKWEKWIKDIESDFGSKKLRVISNLVSNVDPGSEAWRRELDAGVTVDDGRVAQTRDAFMTYIKNVRADENRFKREIQRLQARARVTPVDPGSSLAKAGDPASYPNLLLSGAKKR